MAQPRNSRRRGRGDGPGDRRPLNARSVIASTLLGMERPQLPARLIVRSGLLFGIPEGTSRVAISRMLAAGELEQVDGVYRLAGPLLDRRARQQASRSPSATDLRRWDGRWEMAVTRAEARTAKARTALRDDMRALHLAPLRDGVWLRPANLDPDRSPDARRRVEDQCALFLAEPEPAADGADLAATLWDLDGWRAEAEALDEELADLLPQLQAGDVDALAPAFVVSAAALRHLVADPLLPVELLPRGWPGADLRRTYDGYDRAFKATWRAWFRRETAALADDRG